MTARLLLLVAMLFAASGCTSYRAYQRGLPKRVEVEKRVGEPSAVLVATPHGADKLAIVALERRRVRLERRVVYSTVEIRAEWNSNILWELIEVPWGLVSMPIAAVMFGFGFYDPPNTPNMVNDIVAYRLAWIFGFANPAQSVLHPDIVWDPTSDKEVFFSQPLVTSYDVSLPKQGVEVTVVVEDGAGRVMQRATSKSDLFGRVFVTLPAGAAIVEATAAGAKVSYRVPPPKAPAAEPAEPVPAPAPAPAPTPAAAASAADQ